MGDKGIIASTAGLAILLNEGIGDTIRVSLTPEPGAPREREVEVAQQVLQSMGLRSFLPQVSRRARAAAAPRRTFFQEMAQQIQGYLKDRMPEWRETHPGAEELRVAVMGCVVNGPGESQARRHRDLPAGHVRGAGRARCSSTASSTGRCAATASSPSSSTSSRTTSPRRRTAGSPLRPTLVEASTRPGVYSAPTERPLRDVGDPHVFFRTGRSWHRAQRTEAIVSRDFVGALLQLNAEKQVSREQLIGAVEDGIQSAYRRVAGDEDIHVRIDAEIGQIRVFRARRVVEEIEDELTEITVDEAAGHRRRTPSSATSSRPSSSTATCSAASAPRPPSRSSSSASARSSATRSSTSSRAARAS